MVKVSDCKSGLYEFESHPCLIRCCSSMVEHEAVSLHFSCNYLVSSPFSIASVHGVTDNTIAYEAIISGSNPDERTTAY